MNYRSTLDYLYSQIPMFHHVGFSAYKPGLGNTLEIARILGNPEKNFKTLHLAGTNGKGSTSHFLASVLQEAGYNTGLFTSPHLRDFRERIRLNGRMIPKSSVTEFVREFRKDFDQIQPSFFEWTFGLACRYFNDSRVDVAVMETGLGGRLDSTNIISPVVSIITNIGYDHMQFLGNTLELIATEKAGIIKPGVPAVIGETQSETKEVFISRAKECETEIFFADQQFSVHSFRLPEKGKLRLKAEITDHRNRQIWSLESPLAGIYQLKNLCTLLQTIEVLRQQGFRIEPGHVQAGIRRVILNTRLMGRWQLIGRDPLTIADIGHNKDGISEIVRQINLTKHDQLHFVLGVVNDKDVDAMLALLPADASYYFCKADIPRGLDSSLLMEKALSAGLNGKAYSTVNEALETARRKAGRNDLVVVGGSAFVVAEVI